MAFTAVGTIPVLIRQGLINQHKQRMATTAVVNQLIGICFWRLH